MKMPGDGEIKIHVKVTGPDGATIELGHVSGKTTTSEPKKESIVQQMAAKVAD
ncbi:MAG: hypothetical protein GF403_04330 [Candidatus Coatesbacteria bacterium]|nr:hypothetical protein [Candidatus Coatesbacteria bacterium]